MTNESLGDAILECRLAQNLTQEDIAGKTGFHRVFISRIENGYCTPTMATLNAVAEALGTRGWRLLQRSEDPDLQVVRPPGSGKVPQRRNVLGRENLDERPSTKAKKRQRRLPKGNSVDSPDAIAARKRLGFLVARNVRSTQQ